MSTGGSEKHPSRKRPSSTLEREGRDAKPLMMWRVPNPTAGHGHSGSKDNKQGPQTSADRLKRRMWTYMLESVRRSTTELIELCRDYHDAALCKEGIYAMKESIAELEKMELEIEINEVPVQESASLQLRKSAENLLSKGVKTPTRRDRPAKSVPASPDRKGGYPAHRSAGKKTTEPSTNTKKDIEESSPVPHKPKVAWENPPSLDPASMDQGDVTPPRTSQSISLREKLSSPDRKKKPEDIRRTCEEKRKVVERNRERIASERQDRVRFSSQRARDAEEKVQRKLVRQKLFSEEKMDQAECAREERIREIQLRAVDENQKAEEVTFIHNLDADNSRRELEEKVEKKMQSSSQRRGELISDIRKKQEELTALEDSAKERRESLELERRNKLMERQEVRKEKEQRVVEGRQRAAAALAAKSDEQARRVAERRTQEEQRRSERMGAMLDKKLLDASERQSQFLEERRRKARKSLDGSLRSSAGSLKSVTDTQRENEMKERKRRWQKKARRVRQRIIALSRKYLAQYKAPPVPKVDSRVVHIVRELSTHVGGPPPLADGVRDLLEELSANLENPDSVECCWFCDLGGFSVVSDILSGYQSHKNMIAFITPVCDVLRDTTLEETNCIFVAHSGVLSQWIGALPMAVSDRMPYLSSLLESIIHVLRDGFSMKDEGDPALRQDFVSLLCCNGTLDELQWFLGESTMPIVSESEEYMIILNIFALLSEITDVRDMNFPKNANVISSLRETYLCGVPTFLSSILLSSAPARASQEVPSLVESLYEVTQVALQFLCSVPAVDLSLLQNVLGGELQREFHHLCVYLLRSLAGKLKSGGDVTDILNYTLLLIAFFVLESPSNQDTLRWGHPLSTLRLMAELPQIYFERKELKFFLLCALASSTLKNEENRKVVSEVVDLKQVAHLVESETWENVIGVPPNVLHIMSPQFWNDSVEFLLS